MKKFCKIVFAVAGIMVIVGAITILSAIIVYNRSESIVGDVTYTFEGAGEGDITGLHCLTTYGKTVFKEGSGWSVAFSDVYLKGASCGVNDHTLYVKTEAPGLVEIFGWKIGLFFDFNKNRSAETVITYPAGVQLTNVFGEAGIGRISIDSMNASSVLIQSPFSSLNIVGGRIGDRFVLDTLFGILRSEGCEINMLTLDMRTGITKLKGVPEAAIDDQSILILKR